MSDNLAQQEESLDMIKEMFSLLNNCNPDGNSIVVVMATFVQWLQSSPNSILLMPCLKASSRSLASLNHMAQISEVCIETYFSSGNNLFLTVCEESHIMFEIDTFNCCHVANGDITVSKIWVNQENKKRHQVIKFNVSALGLFQ